MQTAGTTACVLVENSAAEGLLCEHGLSVYVEHVFAGARTRLLLDFGQSDAFARNAARLGVDLSQVDVAALSHAHYDHADGLPFFCAENDHAPVYLSAACAERCWSTKGGTTSAHYIGPKRGMLEEYRERLVRVPADRVSCIAPGAHLVPHTTPGLSERGEREGMLLRTGVDEEATWQPDDFAHEMSLVLELGDGASSPLMVLNSCSHAGVPAIVGEVRRAFPGRRIAAYVGGLHLVHASDQSIAEVAQTLEEAGVERIYTGHCTGAHAQEMLAQALPGRLFPLYPGLRI
ncbi:MAG: MBL fold metallo-hydrolase [Coriobacteriales bacterium]|nr:MBL fold metallo-hydrolase [Coriobacteriales bacterium]